MYTGCFARVHLPCTNHNLPVPIIPNDLKYTVAILFFPYGYAYQISMALFESTVSALDSASGSVLSSEALTKHVRKAGAVVKTTAGPS